ncbi:sensor histidine kinase [Janthinobacterium fluminis]|uniref:histidine kinase n=1 Tax=Janthinobacterium fluminis TaxID=2987524 RepID=A0ABT5JYS9_9BURK|nr:HAMP domain-containing sensor histidine kinase [Janthinobacterium fluminis]MDC8757877.1 HAMP domain-containing sensor histidine kinase [Janthinobacterium fluminis]
MSRLSFRQLLFAAFILIAGVLTATSVQALLTLERLARLGRESAAQAVMLTEQSQRLSERTLAMERSARQFLVLDDPVFRERYVAAWQDANAALLALGGALPGLPPALLAEWRAQGEAAWDVLKTAPRRKQAGHPALHKAFERLPALNDSLARASKSEIGRRGDALLGELERQRRLLAALVGGAVALAALLAACFGLVLSRPLRRIESAIGLLGANRLDQAISVGGPADTRRLGRQLDWLRQRLADLDADKERFLRHISHELKTPLAALREGVALLEDEVAGPLTAGQREIAGILRHNAASLQTQIEDLLRYNTAAFDAQHLQRASVDVPALLRAVVDGQRLQCQARRLRVEVRGAPVSALADADKLSAALANVLSNAVRFSPEGGAIVFAVEAGPEALRIDCSDEGPGVAPQDGERIFEPFYQGARQAAGARNGNGIGLSIVRQYVAAHHGSVALLPSATGAHFRIELPYDA